jgi:hypothetical protein
MKLMGFENDKLRVKQNKTVARVWIPAAPELAALKRGKPER